MLASVKVNGTEEEEEAAEAPDGRRISEVAEARRRRRSSRMVALGWTRRKKENRQTEGRTTARRHRDLESNAADDVQSMLSGAIWLSLYSFYLVLFCVDLTKEPSAHQGETWRQPMVS